MGREDVVDVTCNRPHLWLTLWLTALLSFVLSRVLINSTQAVHVAGQIKTPPSELVVDWIPMIAKKHNFRGKFMRSKFFPKSN